MQDADQNKRPERHRKFFADINEGCVRRIDRASVPLLGVQNGKIVHDRTGVLYRVGRHHFILSAAHDLRQIVNANIPLYVSMNRPGVMPIPLGNATFCSTEEVGRDAAAIWLPLELSVEVARYKDFLPHSQIDLEGADRQGPFAFFGYPTKWSGHVIGDYIVSRGLVFATFPHNGRRLETTYYDPAMHMLLDFTRDAIRATEGGVERLPKLNGISGCGVWQVGDIEGKTVRPRSQDSVTLVGIQHRWFPDLDYVQATKIRHSLAFILENFPDAAAAMKLVYPKIGSDR